MNISPDTAKECGLLKTDPSTRWGGRSMTKKKRNCLDSNQILVMCPGSSSKSRLTDRLTDRPTDRQLYSDSDTATS